MKLCLGRMIACTKRNTKGKENQTKPKRDKIEFIEKKKNALQRIGMKVIGTK